MILSKKIILPWFFLFLDFFCTDFLKISASKYFFDAFIEITTKNWCYTQKIGRDPCSWEIFQKVDAALRTDRRKGFWATTQNITCLTSDISSNISRSPGMFLFKNSKKGYFHCKNPNVSLKKEKQIEIFLLT